MFALQRLQESLERLRKQRLACPLRDHFIRVAREHREHLRAVRRLQMRRARADRQLPFACRASMPQVFDDFRAEGFHRAPASSSSRSAPSYRRSPASRAPASFARSIPATPPRSPPRSPRTPFSPQNAAFRPPVLPHPAAPLRPPRCEAGSPPKSKPPDQARASPRNPPLPFLKPARPVLQPRRSMSSAPPGSSSSVAVADDRDSAAMHSGQRAPAPRSTAQWQPPPRSPSISAGAESRLLVFLRAPRAPHPREPHR